jgi:hypothetical protein
LSWSRTPDVGGGLIIETDLDTRIYVGDKIVGTTRVSFTWEELFGDANHGATRMSGGVINGHKAGELFGDERHSGIAVELADPAQGLTAEMLSGPGATKLSEATGMEMTGAKRASVSTEGVHDSAGGWQPR